MKAAKPARRFSRKPITRTVGSETGLLGSKGFSRCSANDGAGVKVYLACPAHHGIHLLQVTMRFRLVNRFSSSGKNRTAQR